MEPIPETVEALREMTRYGDDTVARTLLHISRAVEEIVPEVVGISLSLIDENVTFTMTATTGPVAELDAMQYVDGGPCDEALRTGDVHVFRTGDVVDEERWRLFARATAAAGVASTLSLPIVHEGSVIAGINLYASTVDAFAGKADELAEVSGAWAGGAVKNADLDFSTRFEASEAPDRLRTQHMLDQAAGVLMSGLGLDLDRAEQRIADAARRAGISDAQVARAILQLFDSSTDDEDADGTDSYDE